MKKLTITDLPSAIVFKSSKTTLYVDKKFHPRRNGGFILRADNGIISLRKRVPDCETFCSSLSLWKWLWK